MANLYGLFATLGLTLMVGEAAVVQNINQVPPPPEETKTEYIVKQPITPLVEPVVTIHYETIEHDRDAELFTEKEAKEIMGVAMLEAGGEGEDGMWLVMSVVFNRVKDPDHPNTVHDVVYQKYAFSAVTEKKMQEVKFSEECMRAYARIQTGDICPEIIGFETKDSDELDKYFDMVFVYRNHKFYVKKAN